jgi:hypothetical protein
MQYCRTKYCPRKAQHHAPQPYTPLVSQRREFRRLRLFLQDRVLSDVAGVGFAQFLHVFLI